MEIFNKINGFCKKILSTITDQAKDSEKQMIPFGIFGFVLYPILYFINIYLLTSTQVYVNLPTRIIASIMCLFLILKNYWPKKLKKYLPLYWYLTIWYVIPFFVGYNLIGNNFSIAWLVNLLAISILLMLLVDWVTYAILFLSGVICGGLMYYLIHHSPVMFHPGDVGYADILTSLSISVIMGVIFSRNRAMIEKGKIQALRTVSETIAHELRTPFGTIRASVLGIKKFFPDLLATYQIAKKNNLPIPYIFPDQFESLLTSCDYIESETEAAFTSINMLLKKSEEPHLFSNQDTEDLISINECIGTALHRYPFGPEEKKLINWNDSYDFNFKGQKILMEHVLFNLLKNSLYQINAIRKGEIYIWTEPKKGYNELHFKDTASGIPANLVSRIFDRFFTTTMHGTGIGLAFCKTVMESINGSISCHSIKGEYIEFVLTFPKL